MLERSLNIGVIEENRLMGKDVPINIFLRRIMEILKVAKELMSRQRSKRGRGPMRERLGIIKAPGSLRDLT